jgi:lysophospholipase L1-like esterase
MLNRRGYAMLAIALIPALASIAENPLLPALTAKLKHGAPVTFACLGDSVTGVYYHTGGRRAYTDMLKLALEQGCPGVEFTAINAGVSGNTTVDALKRLEQDVLRHKPDLVTIMFGLNDITRVPIETYRANLKTLIERCRDAKAEVVLCTPNNVTDTPDRPTSKLLEYAAIVREVAEAEQVTLADCYNDFEAIRTKDAREWAFLMSDEIHPNMAGHEQIGRTIAYAIAGRSFEVQRALPLQPAIPHTLALIRAKQPINVLVMPPYDALLERLLRELAPESPLTITPWDVAGKSLAEIEESAKAIRSNPPDWVFIAVPLEAEAADFDTFKRHFTWTMNYALSFGYQEWDVTSVSPRFTAIIEDEADKERDVWAQRLIWAQDLDPIKWDESPMEPEAKLKTWLTRQLME